MGRDLARGQRLNKKAHNQARKTTVSGGSLRAQMVQKVAKAEQGAPVFKKKKLKGV